MKKELQNDPVGLSSRGRRKFFKRLFQVFAVLWGAGFTAAAFSYLKLPQRLLPLVEQAVEVGPAGGFSPGEGRLVTGHHQPFWVVLADNEEFVALPAVCTHRHCILEFEEETGQLLCPCHQGVFDLNGNVLGGPPPRPLEVLSVTVKGGIVYVYV